MKIIKSSKIKEIKCSCNCLFEYDDGDIQHEKYVYCPECGFEHTLISKETLLKMKEMHNECLLNI